MSSDDSLTFEWDPSKADRNVAKHGLSFEEAATAFGDPFSVRISDSDHSETENRFVLLGEIHSGQLVVVVHTCQDGVPETIRIISARMATRREARSYFDD